MLATATGSQSAAAGSLTATAGSISAAGNATATRAGSLAAAGPISAGQSTAGNAAATGARPSDVAEAGAIATLRRHDYRHRQGQSCSADGSKAGRLWRPRIWAIENDRRRKD